MLTKKEIEVLKMIKSGMKQCDISKKLKISQPAISVFKNKAYKKLQDARKLIKIFKEIGVNVEEDEY